MTFWHILVVAVMKQGLDVDDDRLANLMSHHMALRNLAGLPHFVEKTRLSAATLVHNISLLSDEVLAKINRVIVQLGHQVVGHQVDDILKARGDSFVVETDVEYPTDLRLLWDAGTCGDWATGASLYALGRPCLAPSQALAEDAQEGFSESQSGCGSHMVWGEFCKPLI